MRPGNGLLTPAQPKWYARPLKDICLATSVHAVWCRLAKGPHGDAGRMVQLFLKSLKADSIPDKQPRSGRMCKRRASRLNARSLHVRVWKITHVGDIQGSRQVPYCRHHFVDRKPDFSP